MAKQPIMTNRISRKNIDSQTQRLLNEVRQKASMANKRVKRLEKNNLTDLPAYKAYLEYGGGVKFSTAGKDYNQLQAELSRINHFVNSKTSLIREANKYMKDIAQQTGVKFTRVGELPQKLSGFFKLASKIEQYTKTIEGLGSSLGYQKIWEVINKYAETENKSFDQIMKDGKDLIPKIADTLSSSLAGELAEEMGKFNMWEEI